MNSVRKTVALTGATGFIGAGILKTLSSESYFVNALTRQPRPTNDPHIRWVEGDLHNLSSLVKLCENADVVIHCAAVVRGNSWRYFKENNVDGTQNLLDAMVRTQFNGKLLFISSLTARHPEYSWYAKSKKVAEELVIGYPCEFERVVFRPTAVYGQGDKEVQPIFDSMAKGVIIAPANPLSRFSVIHVDDLVRTVFAWIQSKTALDQSVFELDDGTKTGFSWEEFVSLGEKKLGRKIKRIYIPKRILKVFSHINLICGRVFRYQVMLSPGKVNEIMHDDWVCNDRRIYEILGFKPLLQLPQRMFN